MRIQRSVGSALIAFAVASLFPPALVSAQSAMPDPDVDQAVALAELLNEIPSDIRAACMPTDADVEGGVTAAQCLHEGKVLLYLRLADAASLHAAYDQVAAMAGLAPDTGTACADGPFEGEHVGQGDEVRGRLTCQVGTDGLIALWSDEARLALGVLQLPTLDDWAGLQAAWESAQLAEAGLVAEPGASADPAASAEPTTGTPLASLPAASSRPAAPSSTAALSPGTTLQQWAVAATASSQYGADSWSSAQATGEPDTPEYGDHPTAWAPSTYDGGLEWIELTFDHAVLPDEVVVYESSGNGFVTEVELWDPQSEAWVTAWQGQDQSPEFVIGFSPELAPLGLATDRVRVHVDTSVPGWNEIDAVALVGTIPE